MGLQKFAAVWLLFCIAAGTSFAQKEQIGWKDYLGAASGSHFSPLKQIDDSNAQKLEIAWIYPAPDGSSVFCPLVVDNSNAKAPGGAEFRPEMIHNRSGVGSTVTAIDLNRDGAMDILASTVRGTFIFWGKPKRGK